MTTLTQRATVLTAVQRFIDMANARPSHVKGFPDEHTGQYVYTADTAGRKYIRIVHEYVMPGRTAVGRGLSVHCFIDAETGDVLKAAGWKAPAKDARGNLLTGFDEVEAVFDHHGGYLYKR
jgi:hypothetical protein